MLMTCHSQWQFQLTQSHNQVKKVVIFSHNIQEPITANVMRR